MFSKFIVVVTILITLSQVKSFSHINSKATGVASRTTFSQVATQKYAVPSGSEEENLLYGKLVEKLSKTKLGEDVVSGVDKLKSMVGEYPFESISKLQDNLKSVSLHSSQDVIQFFYSPEYISGLNDFKTILGSIAATSEIALPVIAATAALFAVVLSTVDDKLVDSPYSAGTSTYSVATAEKFYSSKPLFVLKRLIKLASITGAFNFKLLLDWRLGNVEKNQKERAKEALILATQLGPTFIKLGQALSIRTDLIPEAYALELRQLQDAVPPFNTDLALEIIKGDLGINDISEKYAHLILFFFNLY